MVYLGLLPRFCGTRVCKMEMIHEVRTSTVFQILPLEKPLDRVEQSCGADETQSRRFTR